MKHHQIRKNLQQLTRKELEQLSQRVLGTSNSSLKNKDALINVLLQKHRRVAELLGLKLSWWERHYVHVYGLIGVVSLGFAVATVLYPRSNTADPAPIDPLIRQAVLDQVARVLSSKPVIQKEPSAQRIEIEAVPDPTTTGFELIEHAVVFDLRSFQPVSSIDQGKKRSPVVQHVRQLLINTDNAAKYRLWADTSGLDVYSHSTTHKDRLVVYASDERRTVAQYLVRPRILEFDVSDDPQNSEFTIQVTKTFWNAFQNPDQSWVGVVVGVPTKNIRCLIIFPEDKPYTRFDHFVNDENKNRIALPDETYVLEDPQKRWIWWNIVDPKLGHGYNIDWEW